MLNRKKQAFLSGVLLMMTVAACGNLSQETGKQQSQTENNSEAKNDTENSQSEEEATGSLSGTEDFEVTETESQEPEPVITEITISAVGDVTLGTNQKTSYGGSFHEYYDKYGKDYFLKNVKSVFEEDDFTIINFEGTLTNSDNIRETKEWNHKGKPEYVEILTGASVEAATLGNNHIMDYQQDGVNDTISTLTDAGIEYAISGTWGDHYGMYETKGIQIGFVSVNEYYEGQSVYAYLEEGLKLLREQGADLAIACTHWGGDKVHEIEQDQYDMGRWCIDQGYDLVVGCHPHVLQGIECYKGKYIVYSMGNFCYGGSKNPADKDSMIFQQTFRFVDGVLEPDTSAIRAIPCRLSSSTSKNDYCPEILEGSEAESVIANLNRYSKEFGIAFDAQGYLISGGENETQDEAE